MAKINLQDLATLQNESSAISIINNNNAILEAALDNTLSRDGTPPNQMTNNLDMNNQQIFNLPVPATSTSPVRISDVIDPDITIQIPPTGTSGNVVPFLSGDNTWSGKQTFTKDTTATNISATNINVSGNVVVTGTATASTAAVDTNTTQLATTAFVLGQKSTSTPLMDGTAAVGSSLRYARGDHVHPIDTSRLAVIRPLYYGLTTAYTLGLDDLYRILFLDPNSAQLNVTVPLNSSVAFPVGSQVDIMQAGDSNRLQINAAVGVNVNSYLNQKALSGPFATASLYKIQTDVWVLFGNLKA